MQAASGAQSAALYVFSGEVWENSFNVLTRNGIDAARVKWMAAAKSSQAQPNATSDAVDVDGVTHVFRTGRIESASRGQQRRDHAFVYGQEQEDRASQR